MRMVHVATAPSAFEAKVLAARLGADGILWELRGGVDGLYPLGGVEVLVAEDDVEQARELLLADEVEAAFDAPEPARAGARWPLPLLVLAVVAFSVARIVALAA